MQEFEIVTLKSGIKSLRSLVREETFHPVTGPWVEAHILHVAQQDLVKRCQQSQKFVIWDVGLGAAANVLAAIDALSRCGSQAEVEIYSFDKTTLPAEFALSHASELEYILPFEGLLRTLLEKRKVLISSEGGGPSIQWAFHLGDFRDQLVDCRLPKPNAIFYDPYSPSKNLEMWSLAHFKMLKKCLGSEVPFLLTSYSRSTAVRTTLLLAGFFVGRGCEVGEKFETTVVSNKIDLLKNPLDRVWLDRVRLSTNSAPLVDSHYSKAAMREEDFNLLQNLPQFHRSNL